MKVYITPGVTIAQSIDGIRYEFSVLNYKNISGYAEVIIKDVSTGKTYHSDGWIEINGHIFSTRWNSEYNPLREQWQCGRDLIIEII